MKVKKTVIGRLEKCYSLSLLNYKGKDHVLVAAEKVNNCELYDLDGNREEIIWSKPGGVMTMVPLPNSGGAFLATHEFYSPNDSEKARIVIAEPCESGWNVRTLLDLPFVHRFDVIPVNGINYLIACTLKSGHKFKDDWSSPGKVFAMILPEDLSRYHADNQLKPDMLMEGLTKNHGYTRFVKPDGTIQAVISSDNGVFCLTPPESRGGHWTIEKLLDTPASDAQMIDLDSDGKAELCVLSPFHGDTIKIYRETGVGYKLDYEYPHKLEFLHAICGCMIGGKPVFITGQRKGKRDLIAIYWDENKKIYKSEIIDRDCGSANIMHFRKNSKDYLVGANREINEIALYEIEIK